MSKNKLTYDLYTLPEIVMFYAFDMGARDGENIPKIDASSESDEIADVRFSADRMHRGIRNAAVVILDGVAYTLDDARRENVAVVTYGYQLSKYRFATRVRFRKATTKLIVASTPFEGWSGDMADAIAYVQASNYIGTGVLCSEQDARDWLRLTQAIWPALQQNEQALGML